MLLSYKECIERYGSDYKLKQELEKGKLHQLDRGLYSDGLRYSEKELISLKYPRAVFTGMSAFYYHGLSDVIPDYYTLATKRQDTRINEPDIKQCFIKDDLFNIGIITMNSDGTTIKIYNIERMLIELIRSRSKYPLDYYKEIINNYRKRISEMDFVKLEEYASKFNNRKKIMEAIQLEVL